MVQLGDIVIDKITGYTGVATARLEKLYENVQIYVEPEADSEKFAIWISESRLSTSNQKYENFSITVTNENKGE